MKISNAKILMGNDSSLTPFIETEKQFFKILPDFRHRPDQIYHIWKIPLDDPLIILPSICWDCEASFLANLQDTY